jgi:hypothetical protein
MGFTLANSGDSLTVKSQICGAVDDLIVVDPLKEVRKRKLTWDSFELLLEKAIGWYQQCPKGGTRGLLKNCHKTKRF